MYIANDSDGKQWLFEEKPFINGKQWLYRNYEYGMENRFIKFNLGDDWRHSLHEILIDENGNFIKMKKILPELKMDDKIYVRDHEQIGKWIPRHFSHFSPNGDICVFFSGNSSWTASSSWTTSEIEVWKYFKLRED